jgi:membrane-bound serine protease (ClpP class)
MPIKESMMRTRSLAIALAILAGFLFLNTRAADREIALLEISGAIGPATTDYLVRGIDLAVESGDQAVIIVIDTPGGLDAATRDINQAILAAKIPVITYVHPEGARAASAGTYILYASHVAAMAPATNLGAATPVQIIGGSEPDKKSPDGDGDEDEDKAKQDTGSAMAKKAVNDSVAYIRGLAEKRGRNADWAEAAVRDAESLSATAALEQGVIDLMASDLDDLLAQLDGREIETAEGTLTLETEGTAVHRIDPDWRNRLLARITDPTVAYLLFMLGIYGLMFEGYNPGVLVPGIVGAICLLLALYAFQVLPVNFTGIMLIVLGVILMVAEAFAPSFGALGIGGLVALVIGSIVLMDADLPGMVVSRTVIGGIAALSGLVFMGITVLAVRARTRPLASGTGLLMGQVAQVIDNKGRVHLSGEDWQTRCDHSLEPGDRVEVTNIEGLTLSVRKLTTKTEGD